MDTLSKEYKEAKERFFELNKTFSQLKQLSKENQDFFISEIDMYYKQLVDKGLQLQINDQNYTKTVKNKEIDITEIVLQFSIKPEEKIRQVLGKDGIGFKFNRYTNDWYINRLDLVANKKNLEYLTNLMKATKDRNFSQLPDLQSFKGVIKNIPEPEPEFRPKNDKVVINPNLCFWCQKKPNKTTGNYPTTAGNIVRKNTCLSCSITEVDSIVQV